MFLPVGWTLGLSGGSAAPSLLLGLAQHHPWVLQGPWDKQGRGEVSPSCSWDPPAQCE